MLIVFKATKTSQNMECTQSILRLAAHAPYYNNALGGKKESVAFQEQNTNGDGVCSVSIMYFAIRKLPASCILEFLRLPSGDNPQSLLCSAFHSCEKMAFSYHISILHKEENILSC